VIALTLAVALSLRDIVFVNQTHIPIFHIRIGHVTDGTWSDDLLGFADVIDVSRGVPLHVPVDPGICTYDVQATLRNDAVVVVPSVNLCTTDHLEIRLNTP
jgi:hypothetical protein